jgi:hypothetical protein
LSSGQQSRRPGAKIVTMDRSEPEGEGSDTGPRIIHLDVPRGR